jgi:hypothetical protein
VNTIALNQIQTNSKMQTLLNKWVKLQLYWLHFQIHQTFCQVSRVRVETCEEKLNTENRYFSVE